MGARPEVAECPLDDGPLQGDQSCQSYDDPVPSNVQNVQYT